LRSGRVTAVAKPIHIGRTTHVWDIRLTSDEGKAKIVDYLAPTPAPPVGPGSRLMPAPRPSP